MPSARQLTDHWLHKGGDIFRRAERFIWLETLRMAGLALSAALCGQSTFTVQVCQLRLLAVLQCLGGENLLVEATQRQALEALYGTPGPKHHGAGYQLLTLHGMLYRTCRVARQFHRRALSVTSQWERPHRPGSPLHSVPCGSVRQPTTIITFIRKRKRWQHTVQQNQQKNAQKRKNSSTVLAVV